ncbi:UNVERIFIED_CONTAM: hypothetical protein HDU68_002302 [Siphonaria sp. JEL0065]|nr:hypothetical protein HDU68_002302 [Siphonaria sp. JEL0065]
MTSLVLTPLPDSPESTTLLLQLRNECGWDMDKVPLWIQQAQEGNRINLAIQLDNENAKTNVGMISLVLRDDNYMLNIDKCLANPSTKTALIKSLFIRHDFQGKGYGKRAIILLEEYAVKEFGIQIMTLDTAAHNENSMAMYPKLGYIEFRERVPVDYSPAGSAFFKKTLKKE